MLFWNRLIFGEVYFHIEKYVPLGKFLKPYFFKKILQCKTHIFSQVKMTFKIADRKMIKQKNLYKTRY